ncbi:hypothetical protein QAD02_013486 [Eretmocerus hayati]|uniref:Uncharacterized protein n=1 Tax=Eretmocerus hayati TaxID=131215 RepID=A0ACC2P301_9HYME|nr:hypothetical protein QAD02_013486 [Eretmocerus hayati]
MAILEYQAQEMPGINISIDEDEETREMKIRLIKSESARIELESKVTQLHTEKRIQDEVIERLAERVEQLEQKTAQNIREGARRSLHMDFQAPSTSQDSGVHSQSSRSNTSRQYTRTTCRRTKKPRKDLGNFTPSDDRLYKSYEKYKPLQKWTYKNPVTGAETPMRHLCYGESVTEKTWRAMRSKDPPTFARMGARGLWRTLRKLSNRAVDITRVTAHLNYDSPRKPLSAKKFACLKKMYYRQVDRKVPEEKRQMMYRKLNDYVGSAINTAFQTMKSKLEDSNASSMESVDSPLAEPLENDAENDEASPGEPNLDEWDAPTPKSNAFQRTHSSRRQPVRSQWDARSPATTPTRSKGLTMVTPSPSGSTASYFVRNSRHDRNEPNNTNHRYRDLSASSHHSRSVREQSRSERGHSQSRNRARDHLAAGIDYTNEIAEKRPRLTADTDHSREYVPIPLRNNTSHHRGDISRGNQSHPKDTANRREEHHTVSNSSRNKSGERTSQRPQSYAQVDTVRRSVNLTESGLTSRSLQHGPAKVLPYRFHERPLHRSTLPRVDSSPKTNHGPSDKVTHGLLRPTPVGMIGQEFARNRLQFGQDIHRAYSGRNSSSRSSCTVTSGELQKTSEEAISSKSRQNTSRIRQNDQHVRMSGTNVLDENHIVSSRDLNFPASKPMPRVFENECHPRTMLNFNPSPPRPDVSSPIFARRRATRRLSDSRGNSAERDREPPQPKQDSPSLLSPPRRKNVRRLNVSSPDSQE